MSFPLLCFYVAFYLCTNNPTFTLIAFPLCALIYILCCIGYAKISSKQQNKGDRNNGTH